MEGFEIPIHRSLTQDILIAGVPREIAIINGSLAAIFIFSLTSLVGILISLGIHQVFVHLTKSDSKCFASFQRHLTHKKIYED